MASAAELRLTPKDIYNIRELVAIVLAVCMFGVLCAGAAHASMVSGRSRVVRDVQGETFGFQIYKLADGTLTWTWEFGGVISSRERTQDASAQGWRKRIIRSVSVAANRHREVGGEVVKIPILTGVSATSFDECDHPAPGAALADDPRAGAVVRGKDAILLQPPPPGRAALALPVG